MSPLLVAEITKIEILGMYLDGRIDAELFCIQMEGRALIPRGVMPPLWKVAGSLVGMSSSSPLGSRISLSRLRAARYKLVSHGHRLGLWVSQL